MTFDIPPHTIAQMDQRKSAVKEALQTVVDGHRQNIDEFGHDQAIMVLAHDAVETMTLAPMVIADLLAMAIDHMSQEG